MQIHLIVLGGLLLVSGLAEAQSGQASMRIAPNSPAISDVRVCQSNCGASDTLRTWMPPDRPLIEFQPIQANGQALPVADFLWQSQPGPLAAISGQGTWVNEPVDPETGMTRIRRGRNMLAGGVYFYGGDGFLHRFVLNLSAPAGQGAAAGFSEPVRWRLHFNHPEPMGEAQSPGVSAWLDRLRIVMVSDSGTRTLPAQASRFTLAESTWLGYRDRFFLHIIELPATSQVVIGEQGHSIQVDLPPSLDQPLITYSGPLESAALNSHQAALSGVPLADFGAGLGCLAWLMQQLMGVMDAALGSAVAAVLLLALLLGLLIWPLVHILMRARRSVAGEAAATVLAYGLRATVLLAALIAVGHYFPTLGEQFFWIEDLSQPDLIALLPFSLAMIGDAFYLLPVVFLIVFWLALMAMGNARQRIGRKAIADFWGLLMGVVALVLVYTMPASMVLFMTAAALLAMIKAALTRPGASQP